jgi:hypothetical protein
MKHLEKLKEKLDSIDSSGITIQTQKGPFKVKTVKARGEVIGVNVSNLGTSPYLPMDVFVAVILLLSSSHNHTAWKGDAMNCRLGDEGLETDTVEGHIAQVVYGAKLGSSVFRRITPVARILEWAGICENGRGYLRLKG